MCNADTWQVVSVNYYVSLLASLLEVPLGSCADIDTRIEHRMGK